MERQTYARVVLPVVVELPSYVPATAIGEFLRQGVSHIDQRTGKKVHGTCHGLLLKPESATDENPNGLQVYMRGFDDLYATLPANLVTFLHGKDPNELLVRPEPAPRAPSRLGRIAQGVLSLVRPTAG
jgi:hypothetical protein